MCFKKHSILFFFMLGLLTSDYGWAQTPPKITASNSGNQIYCPLIPIKVVTSFNIVNDPADLTVSVFYIQISEGYKNVEDKLTLSGLHPNITATWSAPEGKLTLKSAISAEAI